MEQVGDRVSADKGNSLARQGGEGRGCERGKGKGRNSRRVSANRARDPELPGKGTGAVLEASDRPKRSKYVWRHHGVSADNQHPHGARVSRGMKKTHSGGGGGRRGMEGRRGL